MMGYSSELKKSNTWKSLAMYTHACGYKFCIGVDANGSGGGRGKSVNVEVFAMLGLYDSQLKWPVRAKIAIELLNQQGGENASCTSLNAWNRPTRDYEQLEERFERVVIEQDESGHKHSSVQMKYESRGLTASCYLAFLKHAEVDDYLLNDTLYFNISKTELL